MTQFTFASTGLEVVQSFPKRIEGKTVLITGASQGSVGAETAISLAHGNPKHLILAGRSEDKAIPVMEEIQKINPTIKVEFAHIDLGSQASVREAAADINKVLEKLDILINNAAIMACPYSKTEDGIESQFATNYLGHFLLTNLLLGKMVVAGPEARIVNVTSTANRSGRIRIDDYNFQDGKTYHPIAGYAQSKVAMVLFTVSLSEKLASRGITSFSIHPGSIKTGLQKHMADPAVFQDILEYVKAQSNGKEFVLEELKTLQQGCATTIVAALDPSIESFSGSYLADGDIAKEQPAASLTDPTVAEELWELSEKLVGQRFSLEN